MHPQELRLDRSTRRIWRRRSYGAIALRALVPVALTIPALASLAFVSAVATLVVAAEAIGRRAHRTQIRSTKRALAEEH